MIRSSRRVRALAALAASLPLIFAACSSTDNSAADGAAAPQGDCPTTPVDIVVSVDQWGDIVSQLAGACGNVTTVLASSSVDPHDYEPAPSDAVAFEGAQLVVVNGGHYDEWAAKLAASSAPDAPVVNAVELSEHGEAGHDEAGHDRDADHHHEGLNPHVWYNPTAVNAVSDAVTAELSKLSADGAGYFAERRAEFATSMKPYDDAITAIKNGAAGKSYAATESVFDDMAAALGLADRTPEGYQVAAANESEPSPADLDAFLKLLSDRGVDVLIYNTQTEGSVPEQIRGAAEQAGVPVVEVTETLPPEVKSFQDWQVAQLDALAKAFDVTT
ncbi:zinc ABC transporter substrate-binding protein [Mycobacterium sp. 236(2023)]|uniref:metal ABC transporter solute-binding protein, Zn/Mn family n=1 Tax=Mycobacterium sp. 236(2023) TaxID=3038163 RepID=UPI002414E159|nr:zinc ABC transporter substrate-binding protein [Mycobacterium sp. 236(2023)]MDG4665326.1 zinc ABC transporter substrate-binding protein [Mycobacterium sp. 236(2023)]